MERWTEEKWNEERRRAREFVIERVDERVDAMRILLLTSSGDGIVRSTV